MKGEETEVRDYPCLYPQLPGEIWVRSLKWFPLFSFQRGNINTFYIEKKKPPVFVVTDASYERHTRGRLDWHVTDSFLVKYKIITRAAYGGSES